MSRLYQVQSIRAHKEVDGQTQFLVHWKKYTNAHDSWEPEGNLTDCDKIIEDYLMKVKRQSTPKRQTRSRAIAPQPRRSSRLALQETKTPQDSDVESNKDLDVKQDDTDNAADQEKSEEPVEVEEKKRTRQMKRRSQPNLTAKESTSKDNKEKRVYKRHSHSNLVATASSNLIDNIVEDTQVYKNYDLRHRVQPMAPPVHPMPSSSILLSSDEEAEILSRQPVRRGRSPYRKIGVAPDPTESSEKPHTVVKSLSKYKVTVQEGNLLVRKHAATEPTEAATHKDDEKEEMKPAEPIISDVEEEEEVVAPSQVVVSAAASTTAANTTYPAAPKWMYLNTAEFLLAMVLTALLFITYWCWNSDVC